MRFALAALTILFLLPSQAAAYDWVCASELYTLRIRQTNRTSDDITLVNQITGETLSFTGRYQVDGHTVAIRRIEAGAYTGHWIYVLYDDRDIDAPRATIERRPERFGERAAAHEFRCRDEAPR